jgi:hypothetical protein
VWQDLVVGFREGMPRHRRRVKMKQHEECFTGSEAVRWLHQYLQSSGSFGVVSKQQAVKLLQKFQQSEVIREVCGKQHQFTEDSSCRYSFVTEPGPFNFIEEPSLCVSPLGKRDRSKSCVTRSYKAKENPRERVGGAFFANSHALMKISEDAEEDRKGGGRRKSPRLSVVDVNSGMLKPSPSQVAEIWKELTLARLLRLIDMPALDGVLSHSAVDEAVEDFPGWVTTMMSCLSKWPEGCPTNMPAGRPNTFGLETEVLHSLAQYLRALPEPLISTNLYSLHMAINRLVREGKPSAADALQLCSLLLPQTNRTRVHRLLRTIHKASNNPQLHLSSTQSNSDVLISMLSMAVLRPDSSLECTEQDQEDIQNLILFMSQNYHHIFKVPSNIKQQVDKRIRALSTGKETVDACEAKSFCKRVTHTEYQSQMQAVSQQSISSLLDRIASDESINDREKKHKLKMFQQQYPDIYAKKFGHSSPSSSPRMSFTRSWQFQSLRKHSKPALK